MNKEIWNVLRNYNMFDPAAVKIDALGGAGGFSGAQFWRIGQSPDADDHPKNRCDPLSEGRQNPRQPASVFCLRRWPKENPNAEKLRWIHAVLAAAQQRGVPLAMPERTGAGQTFVTQRNSLWELTPWMPGQPETPSENTVEKQTSPNANRLTAAMQMLAAFHAGAAEVFPLRKAPSPGLQDRLALLRRMQAETAGRLSTAEAPAEAKILGVYKAPLLEHFHVLALRCESVLNAAARVSVDLQPCIRDIHPAHVFFQGEHVSGLIDFGAMRYETVAGDIARLLGGYCADHQPGWQQGLAAYEKVRRLTAEERKLVPVFDASGVLLSGMNWLCWIFLERRRFEDLDVVAARLKEILLRLQHWRCV